MLWRKWVMDSLATLTKALVHPNRAPRPLLISACDFSEGLSRALGNRPSRTAPSPLSTSTCPNLIHNSLGTRSYEPQQWGTSLSGFRHSGDTVYAADCLAWRHSDLVDIHRMARRDPSRQALCAAYGAPFSQAKRSAVAGGVPCSVHWPGACSPDSAQM